MADVYAADNALLDGELSQIRSASSAHFTVTADPDPDVLSRVANQFNFANVAPWQFSMSRTAEETVVCEIEIRGIAPEMAEFIRRKLMQLTCVLEVVLTLSEMTDSPP